MVDRYLSLKFGVNPLDGFQETMSTDEQIDDERKMNGRRTPTS